MGADTSQGTDCCGHDQNKATNGYFVQVVKLLKLWRDNFTESANCKATSSKR